MGGHPITIMHNHKRLGYRAVWNIIQGFYEKDVEFTYNDVQKGMDCNISTTRDYVNRYEKGGYIKVVRKQSSPEGRLGQKVFKAIQTAVEAPRLRQDGTLVVAGQVNDNMWRTMKMAGSFSVQDLAVLASTKTASVSFNTAKSYIHFLLTAGYLERAGRGKYVFLTSKNTGPLPPRIMRVKEVFDPNLGKVVAREVCDE